jgi:hypothetical protein
MAQIKMGIVVSEARGKLNGGVFSRGASGAILRTKVTPINPASNAQQLVRSGLSSIAQAWRGLTDIQRAAWRAFAANVSSTNIFGDNVLLSGLAVFGRVNRNRQTIAQAILPDAPAMAAISQLLTLTLTGAAGTPALAAAFTATPVPAGHTLVIRATPQMSAGRSATKGKFVQLQTVAAAAASPANLLAAYNARFGTLVAGNKVTVTAHYIHIASGLASIPLKSTAIIAA